MHETGRTKGDPVSNDHLQMEIAYCNNMLPHKLHATLCYLTQTCTHCHAHADVNLFAGSGLWVHGGCARASSRGDALGAAAGVLDAGARARRGVGHGAHAGHVHLERGGDAARHVQQHHAGGVVRKQQLDALRIAAVSQAVLEGW